jgi:hypothetical protein
MTTTSAGRRSGTAAEILVANVGAKRPIRRATLFAVKDARVAVSDRGHARQIEPQNGTFRHTRPGNAQACQSRFIQKAVIVAVPATPSAGETECTHGFAVRTSRNVPTRCSRNRRTRSGATATNDLALWGTVEDLFTRRLVGLVAIDRGHESVGIAALPAAKLSRSPLRCQQTRRGGRSAPKATTPCPS